jgi:hypothetical protein
VSALNRTLAGLAPALVIAAVFVPAGDGPAATAARVAAPFLAGLGLFPAAFAARGRSGWLLGIATLAATATGVVLGARLSGAAADVSTLVGWVLIAFATLLGIVAPLLAVSYRATAGAVWLALSALTCGSVLVALREITAVPQAVLDFNPIVRILWHGLAYDWLHAANLYPRIGTIYYRYPDRGDGVLAAVTVGLCGAAAAFLIAFLRRRRVIEP